MKVRELIDLLMKVSPDSLVVLSNDYENNISIPLEEISVGGYFSSNEWYGEFSEVNLDNSFVAVCLRPRG